jgi:hypothetical protein
MNQKAMNEEKFEGIMWRNAGNVFKATKDVHRKPFGYFTIVFAMNANTGETEMEIKSWSFEELNSEKKKYKTFKLAVAASISYFEEMDELIKKLPKTAEYEAKKAYGNVLSKEITKIKTLKW